MSFLSLMNKKFSWKRKSNTGDDGYGGQIVDWIVIGSDVLCRVEGLSEKEIEELNLEGESNASYERLFAENVLDIKPGDNISLFTLAGVAYETNYNRNVKRFEDAAGHGHHTEIIIEKLEVQ